MGRKPGGISFDEEKALELYHQGLTDREIGDKLFISSASICGWRHRRNLPVNYSPMYRGKRPDVTVEAPEGLKTVREREKDETALMEQVQEIRQDADGGRGDNNASELSPPVDGGSADSQQEDRQNLPPLPAARGCL